MKNLIVLVSDVRFREISMIGVGKREYFFLVKFKSTDIVLSVLVLYNL